MAGQNPALVVRVAATIAELRANLAEGKSQIETTTAAMGKLASSFSGDRLIQAAHNVTAAVNQIGGASKLTDAEQARVNATLEKALEKYRVLGKEAPAAMQKLAAETRQVEQSTSLADKAAGFLRSTFAQFTIASLASSAIQSLVAQTKEFISVGVRLPAVEASFQRLTAALRQDGDAMLVAMTAATKGMVSNFDLMLGANKAMLLGLPVTAESMGELSAAALTLGRAMGLNATQSLNDLITALGRSSPLILDNLGLTVKVGEANEAYAAKLGKTVGQLTDAEKKTAFYEAAMEAARKKTEELGDQTQTLSELITTAWAKVGNVISEGAGKSNVALGQVLSSWKEFSQFLIDTRGGNVFLLAEALEKAAERAEAMKKRTKDVQLTVEAVVNPIESYRKHLVALDAASADLTSEQTALVLQGNKLGESVKEISTALGLNEKAVQAAITAHKELTTTLDAEAKAWAKTLSEIANTAGMEQMNDAIAAQARQLENAEGMWLRERDAFQLNQAAKQAARAEDAAFQAAIDAVTGFVSIGHGPTVPNTSGPGSLQSGVNLAVRPPIVAAPPMVFPGIGGLRGFKDGGPVMQDGPIFAHAGEFVVPKGGMGSVVINVNVGNFIGSDYSAARQLAGIVKKELEQSLGSQRKLDAA